MPTALLDAVRKMCKERANPTSPTPCAYHCAVMPLGDAAIVIWNAALREATKWRQESRMVGERK